MSCLVPFATAASHATAFNARLAAFLEAVHNSSPTDALCATVAEEQRRVAQGAADASAHVAEWTCDWLDEAALAAFCSALVSAVPSWPALARSAGRLLTRIAFLEIVRTGAWTVDERGNVASHLRQLDAAARLWLNAQVPTSVSCGDAADASDASASADESEPDSPDAALPIDPRRSLPHAFCTLVADLLKLLCSVFDVPQLHEWLATLKTEVIGNLERETDAIREWHEEMTIEPGTTATPRATSLYNVAKQRDINALLMAKLWPIEELLYARVPVVALFNDARLDKAAFYNRLDRANSVARLFNVAPREVLDMAGELIGDTDTSQCRDGESINALATRLFERGVDMMRSPEKMDMMMEVTSRIMSVAAEEGDGLLDSVKVFVNPETCNSLGVDPVAFVNKIGQMSGGAGLNAASLISASKLFTGFEAGAGAGSGAGAADTADTDL